MASQPKLPAQFIPVPVRARHDGWSAQMQIDFIQAIADTGCIEEASRRVGTSHARTRVR